MIYESHNTNWKEFAKTFAHDGFKIKQEITSPISGYVDRLQIKERIMASLYNAEDIRY